MNLDCMGSLLRFYLYHFPSSLRILLYNIDSFIHSALLYNSALGYSQLLRYSSRMRPIIPGAIPYPECCYQG